eukprot:174432-Amphidinium_carterae.1
MLRETLVSGRGGGRFSVSSLWGGRIFKYVCVSYAELRCLHSGRRTRAMSLPRAMHLYARSVHSTCRPEVSTSSLHTPKLSEVEWGS